MVNSQHIDMTGKVGYHYLDTTGLRNIQIYSNIHIDITGINFNYFLTAGELNYNPYSVISVIITKYNFIKNRKDMLCFDI